MTSSVSCRIVFLFLCLGGLVGLPSAYAQDQKNNKEEEAGEKKVETDDADDPQTASPSDEKEASAGEGSAEVGDESAAKPQVDSKPAPAATDQPDEPKAVMVKVPARLRGKGYELRIEGEPVDLDQEEIKFKPTLEQLSVDLYDSHGRIVDFRSEFLDQDVLEETKDRAFRFAFQFGSSHSPRPGPWRDIFLSGNRFQLNGELGYMWGPFGLTGHVTYQSEGGGESEGFVAYYSALQFGALINYEMAPFSFARNYWGKILVSPLLGIFYANHSAIITDEEVDVSDRSSNFGYTFGGEMRFPVVNNFFLMGRYFIQHQEIDLSGVGFKTTLPQHNILFGGGYVL